MSNFRPPHTYDYFRYDHGLPMWHPADRFMGSFFGLMLGDIMGSYFEFSSRGAKEVPSAKVLTEKTNVFGMRFGYTDDTILALLGTQALMEGGRKYDQHLQFTYARKYLQAETHWSPNGRCFDMGGSTRQSLTHGEWSAKRDEQNSGNGVLMKLAPYAWHRLITQPCATDPLPYYREVADLTHGSETTVDTAFHLGIMLEGLYMGLPWLSAHGLLTDIYPRHVDLPHYEYRGYARDAMTMALWLMYKQYAWDDAMSLIMDEGGDTDTHAAIFGMLYGAAHPDELVYRMRDVASSVHQYAAVVDLLLSFVKQFNTDSADWQASAATIVRSPLSGELFAQTFPERRWQEARDLKPFEATEIPADTLAAYRQTEFVVFASEGEPEVSFCIGEHSAETRAWMAQHAIKTAGFITAYNPLGEFVAPEINTARHAQLLERVAENQSFAGEGRGHERHADGTCVWAPELSLLVANVSRLEVEALGNAYEQNAVVWITEQGAELMLLR